MRHPAPLIITALLAGPAGCLLAQSPAAPKPAPAASAAAAAPVTWPQDASDIPVDPRAIFGKLPNGLRYIILPNKEPQKRVSLRIHIASGSLDEADDQQGLAHFLEHMVFNGSKHFKADELVPKMQRLGIGFGAHVNAFTSFDETVYMLDLPDLSEDTVSMGFNVLRDFGDGANLEDREITKERGVIMSEKVSSDSVEERLMLQQFAEILPGSIIGKRFPIGQEPVIRTAQRDRFVDFYTRYYTPARMTFVVVGDIDPKEMEKRVKDTFSSMVNPPNPGTDPDLGKVGNFSGVKPAVFADKEVASTDLSMVIVKPYMKGPDTKTKRFANLPVDIAHSIIGQRFERLAKKEGSPILKGSMTRDVMFNHAELGSVDVSVADDRWQDALPVMEQEFRRAYEHGFTDSEFAEAKANILNAFEQAVKSEPTRKSEALASEIAQTINQEAVLSTPETDLAIVKEGLAKLDAKACHEAFRNFWKDQGIHLMLTAKEAAPDTKDKLLAAYNDSHAKEVTAPEQTAAGSFGYQDFGPAGTVKSRKEVADLGISQLVLSNGIHVNLKKTDFEKNAIHLLARVGSGKLFMPAGSPGLDEFSSAIFDGGGLGKHSEEDLEHILAGHNVGSKCEMDEDAFVQAGKTTPEDLELQLQYMAAQLSDPGYRDEALTEFRNAVPVLYQQLLHSAEGAQTKMESWLHGGDVRYTLPEQAKLASYGIDDARKFLDPILSKGYLELSIVGDFDEAKLLPLLLKTYGALPARDEAHPDDSSVRKVAFPAPPQTQNYSYDSKIPQGMALVMWKTPGLRGNQQLYRRLNLVGEILSDRLREKVREELGASYSPEAMASGSEALLDYGLIMAECMGTPKDAKMLAEVATQLGADLAEKGATEDELDRARQPILSQLQESKRDNSYWLGTVMSHCQENPAVLDLVRNRESDYAGIKLEEINQLAKTYLVKNNALQAIITSEEKK